MHQYRVGQVIRGTASGTFKVLYCLTVEGQSRYLVQEVNPADHTEVAPGPLPPPYREDMLRPL